MTMITPQELEGNKLIAEFMGKHLYDDKPAMPTSMQSKGLEYHSNWSWLMQVVHKISDYHYPEYWTHGKDPDAGEWDDTAYPRTFGMRDKEGNYMVRFNANALHYGKTLIEATWNAVVDFITDYNTTPSPTKL